MHTSFTAKNCLHPERIRRNGILLMLLASLFFSIMGALVKFSTARLPSIQVVFFRSAIGLILLSPWMTRKKLPFWGRDKKQLFFRGLWGFIAIILSFYVTSRIYLADAAMLNLTSTFFTAALSAILLKEKIRLALCIYIIIAFIGTLLIIKPGFSIANIPGLLGLVSGFFAAMAYVTIKKLHSTDSFFTIVFSFSIFCTFGSLLAWPTFLAPNLPEWLALTGVGVFGTIAQLLMTYSYKYAEVSVVNSYSFAGVIFSSLWGALFWREIPDIWSVVGGVILIGCGVKIMRMSLDQK